MNDIEDLLSNSSKNIHTLKSVALLPSKDDNAAIATKIIQKGTKIRFEMKTIFEIDSKCLEGHRFCVRTIRKGEHITSWGMPFAVATKDLSPGSYLCNDRIAASLKSRGVMDFELPTANFKDMIPKFSTNSSTFRIS